MSRYPPMDTLEALRTRTIHDPNTDCWIWTGTKAGAGYGQLQIDNRTLSAHRLAYEYATGEHPDGFVMHRCDTPLCINPKHLMVGTTTDNMRDAAKKGRMRRGEAHRNAQYTEAQVLEVDRLLSEKTVREVSALTGVAVGHVYQIRAGRTWKWLTGRGTDT